MMLIIIALLLMPVSAAAQWHNPASGNPWGRMEMLTHAAPSYSVAVQALHITGTKQVYNNCFVASPTTGEMVNICTHPVHFPPGVFSVTGNNSVYDNCYMRSPTSGNMINIC